MKWKSVVLQVEDEVYEAKVRSRVRRDLDDRKGQRKQYAREAREERAYA